MELEIDAIPQSKPVLSKRALALTSGPALTQNVSLLASSLPPQHPPHLQITSKPPRCPIDAIEHVSRKQRPIQNIIEIQKSRDR